MKIDPGSLKPISDDVSSNLNDLFPVVTGLQNFNFADPTGDELVSDGLTKRAAFIASLGLPEGTAEPAIRTAIRRFVEEALAAPFSCEVEREHAFWTDVYMSVDLTNGLRDKKRPLLVYKDWKITNSEYRESLRYDFERNLKNHLLGISGVKSDVAAKFIEDLRNGVLAPVAASPFGFREQVSGMNGAQIHEAYRKDLDGFRSKYDLLMKQDSQN